MPDHLVKRRHGFAYYARVPKRFATIDQRRFVEISLGTVDKSQALQKVGAVHAAQLKLWEAQLKGMSQDQVERFEALRSEAATRGLTYRTARELSQGDLEGILERFDTVNMDKPAQVAAVLGGAERPRFLVSQVLARYLELSKAELMGKDRNQIRNWHHPRQRAFENFQEVLGDIYVDEITRDHELDFRAWWLARLQEEGLGPNSPNKDFQHLSRAFSVVSDMHRLGLSKLFQGMRFKEKARTSRLSFTPDWICEKLIGSNEIRGMNGQARAVLFAMINTGARPSEITQIEPERIRLDGKIPFIQIRPDGRQIKTEHAERDLPLVGVSLEAFREYPTGFDRYRENVNWSNVANKFMRANGLLPTEDHSAYSTRHAFEDRLISVSTPDRIAADLMGHATRRERYGAGPSLAVKAEWVAKIAL